MSLPPWRTDALFAGAAIVERLRDQVPALRLVGEVDAFTDVTDTPKQLPAALVLLHDLRVTVRNAMRAEATTEQDWLVVLAARSASAAGGANAESFGALVPQVVAALQGWAPAGSHRPLAWGTGPRPNYGRNVSWFPLLFTLTVVAA